MPQTNPPYSNIPPKVLCALGTRPEAIKMAPVIHQLRSLQGALSVQVLSTGQQRDLLQPSLADFGLSADIDLGLMAPGDTLAQSTARILSAVSDFLATHKPDLVLAQGDTTTVLATALASFYNKIPFGHVEAGLRTGQPYSPYPEEKNRELTARLAALHFAPTPLAKANLLKESITPDSIFVTGNTIIDALQLIESGHCPPAQQLATPSLLLITAHRRESFGAPLRDIARAIGQLVQAHPDLSALFVVHPNPAARETVRQILGAQERVHLLEPLGYRDFIALLKSARVVLTDSGGVQEEAASLGLPLLVLREATERPEALWYPQALLVGTSPQTIVPAVESLLHQPPRVQTSASPFGDGHAARRIAAISARFLSLNLPALAESCRDWSPQTSDSDPDRGSGSD